MNEMYDCMKTSDDCQKIVFTPEGKHNNDEVRFADCSRHRGANPKNRVAGPGRPEARDPTGPPTETSRNKENNKF